MDDVQELCPFKTTVQWEGYSYTKAYSSGRKTTFRCSYYRSTKCKARVDVMADGSYENAAPHTCGRQSSEGATKATAEDGLASAVEDVVEDMKAEVDALALSNLTLVPSKVWDLVREEFMTKKMTRGLTRDQVISRVYRTRNAHFGSPIYGRVEVPPLSMTKTGDAMFFQFHYTYVDDGEVQHILGWGHPALIRLLSYNQTALYIDGTFHCVPSPFYQCIVIMVQDRGSKCFVPCLYCLTTNKSEWTYWSTLHCVQATTGMAMDVGTVSCDFEKGLINAVGDQFPEADIIGCLFHFKQAIRRKMQKLHIPTEEIYEMMARGMLDALTVIPHERIDPHGIAYVTKKFKMALRVKGRACSESKWDDFWSYFRKTCLEMYPPRLWNIFGIQRTVVNRTNNPLERYNRELNSAFSTSHPNIPTFVGVIEAHAARYVTLLEDIARRRARAPPHGTYVVPQEFTV